jgi:hypothetical protein
MARVEGFEPAHSGQVPVDSSGNPVAVGVWGDSSTGVGVFGTSGTLLPGMDNIPTNIAGVEGHSIQNPGVVGRSVEDAGVSGESLQGLGVLGRSTTGSGVLGVTFVPVDPGGNPSASGVFGSSTVGGNGVVGFVGGATGVVGSSVRGTGVRGSSGDSDGVVGNSLSANGVTGLGGSGRNRGEIASGVFGQSDSGFGIRGVSGSRQGAVGVSFGSGEGVFGLNFSPQPAAGTFGESVLGNGVEGFSFTGIGVRGEGRNGGVRGLSTSTNPNAGGVVGENPNGFAGVFLGKVRVTGFLSKAGGGFEIDHPLDPANKYLSHSFVESPEMLNVYSGNVTTDGHGDAHVTLPEYFEALNEDFRYQLTVMGQFAQAIVGQEIKNNAFTIKSDRPRVRISWQVTGVRRDRWAVANRIAVEAEKAGRDKGRYLHPDLWEQSEEAAIVGFRSARTSGQGSLRRAIELVPERLRPRVDQHLQALQHGDHVDGNDTQKLMAEVRQAARQLYEEPSRIDRAQLEEEWRQVEASVERMRPPTQRDEPGAAGTVLRRVSQLLPEQLKQRLEQHLSALLRGDHVDRGELQSLVVEASQQTDLHSHRELPRIDRARLEEEWRQVEALVQQVRQRSPWMEVRRG